MEAEAEAAAILRVNEAMADSLKLLNESAPTDGVIKIKALEAFQAAANGKATKIIIPSEIQGLAGLAEGIVGNRQAPGDREQASFQGTGVTKPLPRKTLAATQRAFFRKKPVPCNLVPKISVIWGKGPLRIW